MLIFWMLAHPVQSISRFIEEKRWSFIVLYCAIYLLVGTGLFVLLLYLISFLSGVISNVYTTHKETIDGGVFLALCFAAFIYYMRERRKPKAQPKPQPDVNAESKAAERTYVNVASAILPVFQKLAKVFPLVSPISASDIYSPARARKEGEIWYYRYVAVKTGKPDIDIVKRFLNDELERFLFDHEAHGLAKNTVFVGGAEYPALIVTDVKDTGSYLEISLVVMSEKVNRHMNYRRSSRLDAQGKVVNADDEQFIQ